MYKTAKHKLTKKEALVARAEKADISNPVSAGFQFRHDATV